MEGLAFIANGPWEVRSAVCTIRKTGGDTVKLYIAGARGIGVRKISPQHFSAAHHRHQANAAHGARLVDARPVCVAHDLSAGRELRQAQRKRHDAVPRQRQPAFKSVILAGGACTPGSKPSVLIIRRVTGRAP
jgi:hypothetical protein